MQLPGEALLLRLWETLVERGIGTLLRPWQSRREGFVQIELQRAERLMQAQTERDARDVLAGHKELARASGVIRFPLRVVPPEAGNKQEPTPEAITAACAGSARRDAIRREVNVARAIVHAEQCLKNEPQPPPHARIDEDWLYRWRDAASEVSCEELRLLWGRILADELKSPGSFSLRTIEFTRVLSVADAQAIAKLARFVVSNWVYCGERPLLESGGITFPLLLHMQEIGILSGTGGNSLVITFPRSSLVDEGQAFASNGRAIVVRAGNRRKGKPLELPVLRLTRLGQEVVTLGSFEPHETYLRAICREIRSQRFEVALAQCRVAGSGEIELFNETSL
jgi:hypothetical protein